MADASRFPLPASRIRVLHLITKLEFGGAQQNTLYTVGHMDPDRFEIALACGDGGYLDKEALLLPAHVQIFWLKFLTRQVRPWWDLPAFIEIWSVFRRFGPRVAHLHSSKAGILGRWAAWLAGVPIVVHTYHGFGFHDHQHPLARGFLAWIERISGWVTTQLVYVSKKNLEYAGRWKIHAQRAPVLIRSGVNLFDLDRMGAQDRLDKRRELGLAADALIVATVANLKRQKNPEAFIELAARFEHFRPTPVFLFLGGWEGGGAREDIFSNGPSNLKYLGWRKDAAKILKAGDIYVLTSLWEGLPRSAVEALRLGLPVVSYASDGIAEIVKDSENGFLAPPHDLDRLEQRLRELIENPRLRQAMSLKAKASISSEFDINIMVRRQEELYEELIKL